MELHNLSAGRDARRPGLCGPATVAVLGRRGFRRADVVAVGEAAQSRRHRRRTRSAHLESSPSCESTIRTGWPDLGRRPHATLP